MTEPLPLVDGDARPTRRPDGPRAVFILNPAARNAIPRGRLEAVVDIVRMEHPLDPRIVVAERPGHATEIAAAAEADGADYLFACGGDGTLNEVLNGVRADTVSVGQIPTGTANVWAREAGIPSTPRAALRAQLHAPAVPLDLGRAGERRFLLMAGVGLDALAVERANLAMKRRVGPLAYLWAGVTAGLGYPGFDATVRFDDDPPLDITGCEILIGNTRSYGGVVSVTRDASAVDGALDCVIFRGTSLLAKTRVVPLVLLRRQLRSRATVFRRAQRITIERAAPPVQVDGEATPEPAQVFTVEPGAVRMLVPAAGLPLFRAP